MTDRTHPRWDDEDDVLAALGEAIGGDPDRTPPLDRVAAVRAAAERLEPAERQSAPGPDRRLLLTGGIAAGLGGIAGYAARTLVDDEPGAPGGPVVEPIALDPPDGVTAEAGLINHTWGTELLLDARGLEPGRTYDVVYRTRAGDEVAAGSLLAVDGVLMVCRFNAATLRADLHGIDLRTPDGEALLSTELPEQSA